VILVELARRFKKSLKSAKIRPSKTARRSRQTMLDRRILLAGASGLAVIAGLYGVRRPSVAAQRSFEIRKRKPNGEVF
jgi:hypothetical protein